MYSGQTLAEIEKRTTLEALDQFGGVRTYTAIALGISTRTLERRLRKWRVEASKQTKPPPEVTAAFWQWYRENRNGVRR